MLAVAKRNVSETLTIDKIYDMNRLGDRYWIKSDDASICRVSDSLDTDTDELFNRYFIYIIDIYNRE